MWSKDGDKCPCRYIDWPCFWRKKSCGGLLHISPVLMIKYPNVQTAYGCSKCNYKLLISPIYSFGKKELEDANQ